MRKRKHWKMPKWMEPYRDLIENTGGNPIEELMNDHDTHGGNNIIRSALIISVDSQIILLQRLAHRGMLVGVKLADKKQEARDGDESQ